MTTFWIILGLYLVFATGNPNHFPFDDLPPR